MILPVMVALLASAVLFNFLLTFALLARVKKLQQLATDSASREAELPRAGDPVGRFEVENSEGKVLTDAMLAQTESLVGFFAPGCLPCEKVRQQLVRAPPSVPLVAFVDRSNDENGAQTLGASLKGFAQVVYTDQTSSAVRAFRESGYPTLVRVANGVVTAAGHQLRDVT